MCIDSADVATCKNAELSDPPSSSSSLTGRTPCYLLVDYLEAHHWCCSSTKVFDVNMTLCQIIIVTLRIIVSGIIEGNRIIEWCFGHNILRPSQYWDNRLVLNSILTVFPIVTHCCAIVMSLSCSPRNLRVRSYHWLEEAVRPYHRLTSHYLSYRGTCSTAGWFKSKILPWFYW